MRPVLTAEQSAAQDAAANAPITTLMDRAGCAVAHAVLGMGAGYGSRVSVLAGPGNNGGDGYIAAAYLQRRGAAVTVHALAPPRRDPAIWAGKVAARAGATVTAWDEPRPADYVVDALFGGGFRGDLPELGPWTAFSGPVVAVDVPSGLSATTGQAVAGTLVASQTVTFHGLRVGHLIGDGPDLSGPVTVVDIGLPDVEPELWLTEEEDAPLVARSRQAHKWSSGSVLVVGGSSGIDGAAVLAARAALCAGAGAVMIAAPPSAEERIRSPEIMSRAIGSGTHLTGADASAVLDTAARFDALVIGPGLGSQTGSLVPELLDRWDGPVVLDADGLNALADPGPIAKRRGPSVLTPHSGEFERLTGEEASYLAAAGLAGATGATVLLKGNPTFVLGDRRWVVTSGGPELATIGTGDVLAGLIAALWAGGLDGATAARSGAYWHGRAGAHLAQTRVVTADVLAETVAEVVRR